MEQSGLLLFMLILPLVGALTIAYFRDRWSRVALALIGCSTVGLSFAVSVAALLQLSAMPDAFRSLGYTLFSWGDVGGHPFAIGLLGDPVSLWFALVITGVGFLIHLYSAGYMADDASFGRYFAELNYFVFAMTLLVMSDNFVGLIIGWANVGLASYMLIGFWHERPAASAAAKKAFIMNMGGEVGLILGAALIFSQFGSFAYAEVFPRAAEGAPLVMSAIALLLLFGALTKSAQLPMHTWLPDAMQGPTPVSALIHAATMVTAGVYLVARAYPLFEAAPVGLQAVALVGAFSALYGAVVAVGQNDLKKVLAFSTMSQVGFMFLALGVGAYAAGLFHFMTHAFFKALLFLAAGVVIHYLHGEQDIRRMGGLGSKLPFAYWTVLIGGLALVGVPPLAGFFSKDEILVAVLAEGHPWLWAMALVSAGLTAFYTFRMFCLVFAGKPTPDAAVGGTAAAHAGADDHGGGHGHGTHDAAQGHGAAGHGHGADAHGHGEHGDLLRIITVPVMILAVLAVLGGALGVPGWTHVPEDFLGPVFAQHSVVEHVLAGPGGAEAAKAAKGLTIALVLSLSALGILLALRFFGPGVRDKAIAKQGNLGRAMENGFYLDTYYRNLVVRPAEMASSWTGRVADPLIIDGFVHGVAGAARLAAEGLRLLHAGFVRRYALTLLTGVTVLLLYFVMVL